MASTIAITQPIIELRVVRRAQDSWRGCRSTPGTGSVSSGLFSGIGLAPFFQKFWFLLRSRRVLVHSCLDALACGPRTAKKGGFRFAMFAMAFSDLPGASEGLFRERAPPRIRDSRASA